MKKIILALASICIMVNAYGQINNEHLEIGEKAPVIMGVDQYYQSIDSEKILADQKILLVFYRGNWCPHCKRHLLKLQENLEAFRQKGVFVLVVTPEKSEKIQETTEKFDTGFSIVHDRGDQIMTAYKVAFEVNEESIPKYSGFTRKKLLEYNEANSTTLPVPATYVIDKKGYITYVHYDPDYKNRADFGELLESL